MARVNSVIWPVFDVPVVIPVFSSVTSEKRVGFSSFETLEFWSQFLSVIKGVSLFDSAQRENKPRTLPLKVYQVLILDFTKHWAHP